MLGWGLFGAWLVFTCLLLTLRFAVLPKISDYRSEVELAASKAVGQPVRIADVARQMIEESGRDIEIIYTGLREGEKLDEVLYGCAETPFETTNPMVSRVGVPPLPSTA